MGAYNRYNGVPCCASELLLDEILRKQWGFEGYVVSDCNSIRDVSDYHNYVDSKEAAAAVSVLAGCDLECGIRYSYLEGAVEQGLITEEEMDVSLKRLFTARFKLGMFDAPDEVPYSDIPMSVVSSEKHRTLALETARKSMVLLKNEQETLPLSKKVNSIAVIGPNANNLEVLLGNYNGFPLRYMTPLQGVSTKVSPQTQVYYEAGCDLIDTIDAFSLIPESKLTHQGKAGLMAQYFNNPDFSGQPVLTRLEKGINSNWQSSPVKGLMLNEFSGRWEGQINVEVSGKYQLGLQASGGFQLLVDNKVVIDNLEYTKRGPLTRELILNKGQAYDIRVDFKQKGVPSQLQLIWRTPGKSSRDRALEIAQKSDVILFVGGISPRVEGEQNEGALSRI
jgi:beta-glucosidase